MTDRHHVLAIGNALVDVITTCRAGLSAEGQGIAKGWMRLIGAEEAETLYAAMGPGREISGGSAANTLTGMAALGAKPLFVGRVADDQLGRVFAHDIRAAGVDFATPASTGGAPTGRCLIVVTSDGDRTMNTFLGACQELSEADLDPATVAAADILYLEGYLWDPPAPRAAMRKAIAVARANNTKVALTLSDVFCVEGYRADFQALLAEHVDLVFGNEHEVCSLYQTDNLEAAMAELARHAAPPSSPARQLARSSSKAAAIMSLPPSRRPRCSIPPVPAICLPAASWRRWWRGDRSPDCARVGCIAAAEVISHYGARPEADLKALVKARLG